MKRALLVAGVLALSGGLAFAQEQDPNQTNANRATHKANPPASANVTPAVIFPPAAICYTCGGGFRIYGGTLYTAAPANELGPGCSGGFSTNYNDTSPYLCVR